MALRYPKNPSPLNVIALRAIARSAPMTVKVFYHEKGIVVDDGSPISRHLKKVCGRQLVQMLKDFNKEVLISKL